MNISRQYKCSFIAPAKMLAVVILSSSGTYCFAQDLEPRSYSNIPIGMNFLVVGAAHSEGELSPAPSVPIENADLTINAGVVGYAHTFALAGRSSKIDMTASRICYKGSADFQGERVSADRCGYGDPNIRLSWNFYGAPALKPQDFAAWQQGFVVGTSLQITIPAGSYEKNKLINSGANRWVFRPGIGMSHKLGDWYYDLIASVRFYGDNDEYFNRVTLQQEPQYTVQGHLIYNFSRGHWLSLNTNFYFGGETQKNGIDSFDSQENVRFGITYSAPINRSNSIKLYASTGVITQIGSDFDTLGAVWQYIF
ncbi:transporter [Shewanella abyssi]|uniref:transporter n=1 Tax=Shewanella abyssi TaxID=311789 RepID=UPI00200EEABE|nr:transporter [Shewanella abyssi]MCL1048183.1 transporter [Shewanella abyssi]